MAWCLIKHKENFTLPYLWWELLCFVHRTFFHRGVSAVANGRTAERPDKHLTILPSAWTDLSFWVWMWRGDSKRGSYRLNKKMDGCMVVWWFSPHAFVVRWAGIMFTHWTSRQNVMFAVKFVLCTWMLVLENYISKNGTVRYQFTVVGCIQKFPDWVIMKYTLTFWYYSLRSNAKGLCRQKSLDWLTK
jgi:hypothetical protein